MVNNEHKIQDFNQDSENESVDFYAAQKKEKHEKIAFWSLSVLGGVIIIFSIFQSWSIINNPIPGTWANPTPEQREEADRLIAEAGVFDDQNKEDQKLIDTDEDGINDFDEQYVFETNPYLSDTDSDGIDDYIEIKSGDDPTCPMGTTCFITSDAGTDTSDNFDSSLIGGSTIPSGSSSSSNSEIDAVLDSISAAELRGIVLSAGIASEQELLQIDDQTMKQLFKDSVLSSTPEDQTKIINALKQLNDPTSAPTPETDNSGEVKLPTPTSGTDFTNQEALIDDLKQNTSPEQVREMLADLGIDPSMLKDIDDTTLMQMYDEALMEFNSTK